MKNISQICYELRTDAVKNETHIAYGYYFFK